jgi:hypothetical protein
MWFKIDNGDNPIIQMMITFLIQIGNVNRKMVGEIVLKFTYIRLNAEKKIVQNFLSLIISAPSII